jgi:hypothetical protein
MEPNRIVVEIFLEKSSFKEVEKVAKALEEIGIKPILMPPEDRGINTHMVIEKSDLAKAKDKFKQLKVKAVDKEIIIITMVNTPGMMAEAAGKISARGINMNYAFSVPMTANLSYVLLGTENNDAALKALK